MFRCTPRRWVSSNGRDGRSPASVTGRVSGCVEPRTPVREPGSAPAPRAAGMDADTSPPPPVSREAATSLNRAPQARREIGGAFGRPVVAGELAHHERVLRLYAAAVSCDRRQSLPYRSAPRPAREGDEAGFRVRLVFGSERHAAFRDSKKTRDTFPVGQKPRLHAPYRDPEAHSRRGVGKVPLLTGGRAFIPVEVAKRKPGRMPRGLVESAQACPECGNARRVEGSRRQGLVREQLPHRRLVHHSFHDAVDRGPLHQKLDDNWWVSDDALMQRLAQHGNGNAAYVDSLSEARKVLLEQASSTLVTIAKDVKIQVEFNPATVSEYRLIGYKTSMLAREDFRNDRVGAGEIGARRFLAERRSDDAAALPTRRSLALAALRRPVRFCPAPNAWRGFPSRSSVRRSYPRCPPPTDPFSRRWRRSIPRKYSCCRSR